MASSLVSVVIPTHNRAYCLERAINSVLEQTHREVEVIVVDDGSNDGTSDLVKTRYRTEPRVVDRFQANKGMAAARKTGLACATGDYVALLDSDDVWQPWQSRMTRLLVGACLPPVVYEPAARLRPAVRRRRERQAA